MKCHAGCSREQILEALDLTPADLCSENERAPQARLSKGEADQLLEDRGVNARTREAFGITTDLRSQAWRFPIASGAKLKRFRAAKDENKYRWHKKKPANADLYGVDKLPAGTTRVWLLEGEPDVWIAWQAGVPAVSFTLGADNVPPAGVKAVVEAGITGVIICYDADDAGRSGAQKAGAALLEAGLSVEVRGFSDDKPTGFDVTDLYIEVGRDEERLNAALEGLTVVPLIANGSGGPSLDDFHAYLPEHRYIYAPTGVLWPGASVNALFGKVGDESASKHLDQTRAVEQMTWAPGWPRLIHGRLLIEGGWIERPGTTCFNQFHPAAIEPGDPDGAGPWLEHAHAIFPEEAQHLIRWFACRVQHPGEKINHALLLGGAQGTGKDTLIEGAVPAIGMWNVQGVTPEDLFGAFNPYVKSVLLRVNEARDLGERDRYRFYERLKLYIAAPPMVLSVNEKHIRPYAVPNVCGVVITTNHSDGVFLSPDDRRFFVAWTDKTKADFSEAYWKSLHAWYATEGWQNIAAYLLQLDLTEFNPKAPPPKTAAFWAMVDAGRAPEDAELADAIDRLGRPDVLTISMVCVQVRTDFGVNADYNLAEWLEDRANRRQIRHRMEAVGYMHVPNEGASDGRWKVGLHRTTLYGRADISRSDRLAAVARFVAERRP